MEEKMEQGNGLRPIEWSDLENNDLSEACDKAIEADDAFDAQQAMIEWLKIELAIAKNDVKLALDEVSAYRAEVRMLEEENLALRARLN